MLGSRLEKIFRSNIANNSINLTIYRIIMNEQIIKQSGISIKKKKQIKSNHKEYRTFG